jgi:hypothetical protein
MSDSQRITDLVGKWEAGGTLDHTEMAELRAAAVQGEGDLDHRLLLFLERDAGMDRGPSPSATVCEQFTRGVMARITAQQERRRFPSRGMVSAVAAVVLVLLGTFVGLLVGRSSVAPDRVVVQFQLAAPEAGSVTLVGDFSDWEPDRYQLRDTNGDGVWEITVPLRSGQVYTYNFLIDGKTWVTDPDSPMTVDDGFGGQKSVLSL